MCLLLSALLVLPSNAILIIIYFYLEWSQVAGDLTYKNQM